MTDRDLTESERGLIRKLLTDASLPSGDELLAQLPSTRVVGGIPTLLDLEVTGSAPAASVQDGPLSVIGRVMGSSGENEGEILLWIEEGYLSGVEFAWVTDDAPKEFPDPDRVTVAAD